MFIYLFNKMIINNLHIYLFIYTVVTYYEIPFFFQPFYDSKFTCTYKNNIILFLKNYFLYSISKQYKNIKIN